MSLNAKGENWELKINSNIVSLEIFLIEPNRFWDYNSFAEDVLRYAEKIKKKYKIKETGKVIKQEKS